MLLHDLRCDGQSEAGAAEFLGREERLEDVEQRVLRNADAGVGDSEMNGRNGSGVAVADRIRDGTDFEAAAVRHGVMSVDDEIREYLPELMRIRQHRQRWVAVGGDRDQRAGQLHELRLEGLQPFGDVDRDAGRFADAREAEDFLRDPFAARDGVGDSRRGQFYGGIGAGAFGEEIDEGLNAHQHVVELVRDRGRETPEA
jgi:hypothetical protein